MAIATGGAKGEAKKGRDIGGNRQGHPRPPQ